MNETQHPLILVFYLDADLMKNKQIMVPFAEHVNDMIDARGANMMAFFLPTKDEERVECINPVMVSEPEMEKITAMIEEIKLQFSVGVDIDTDKITQCDCDCDCEKDETND